MRKKIKELMNKEEGFTLVELLAVIVILGIIVAIAIPAIGNVTQTAQSGADSAEEALIVDAARLYEVDNKITIGTTTETGVEVKKLISEGYLELRNDNMNTNGTVRRATKTEREDDSVAFIVEDRD